jgi:hypothetical protein
MSVCEDLPLHYWISLGQLFFLPSHVGLWLDATGHKRHRSNLGFCFIGNDDYSPSFQIRRPRRGNIGVSTSRDLSVRAKRRPHVEQCRCCAKNESAHGCSFLYGRCFWLIPVRQISNSPPLPSAQSPRATWQHRCNWVSCLVLNAMAISNFVPAVCLKMAWQCPYNHFLCPNAAPRDQPAQLGMNDRLVKFFAASTASMNIAMLTPAAFPPMQRPRPRWSNWV